MNGALVGVAHPVRKAALAFIFVTVALDMLALGIVVPVLPKLVLAFEGGDSASAAAICGLFGTVYSAMQFMAYRPGGPGRPCPRRGRARPVSCVHRASERAY